MESLGQYLKKERELRGVTLDQIANTTRIGVRFLEAIEADNFEALPAEPFTRGFLRAYARYLGIDSDEIILLYEQYVNGTSHHPETPEINAESDVPRSGKESSSLRVVLPVVIIAAVVVLSIILLQLRPELKGQIAELSEGIKGMTQDEGQQAPKESAGALKADDAVPDNDAGPAASGESAVPGDGLPQMISQANAILEPMGKAPQMGKNSEVKVHPVFSEVVPPGEPDSEEVMTLEVLAKTDTWVEVKVDDADLDDRVLLLSGESRSWYATDRFTLTLGNVEGVALLLNGEEVGLPKTSNNFLSDFSLTRDLLQ